LTKKDIKHLIIRLIGKNNENQINGEDMTLLINKVIILFINFKFISKINNNNNQKIFEEADIDKNNEITIDEFEHIVLKSNEFPV
jgi:hypothetical protein